MTDDTPITSAAQALQEMHRRLWQPYCDAKQGSRAEEVLNNALADCDDLAYRIAPAPAPPPTDALRTLRAQITERRALWMRNYEDAVDIRARINECEVVLSLIAALDTGDAPAPAPDAAAVVAAARPFSVQGGMVVFENGTGERCHMRYPKITEINALHDALRDYDDALPGSRTRLNAAATGSIQHAAAPTGDAGQPHTDSLGTTWQKQADGTLRVVSWPATPTVAPDAAGVVEAARRLAGEAQQEWRAWPRGTGANMALQETLTALAAYDAARKDAPQPAPHGTGAAQDAGEATMPPAPRTDTQGSDGGATYAYWCNAHVSPTPSFPPYNPTAATEPDTFGLPAMQAMGHAVPESPDELTYDPLPLWLNAADVMRIVDARLADAALLELPDLARFVAFTLQAWETGRRLRFPFDADKIAADFAACGEEGGDGDV